MIEKIFNVLFSKNKKVKCLTLVKDRQSFLTKKSCCENKSATTCLSEYFVNRKGLNKTEREQFYSIVLRAHSQR